ncbi:chitinase [Talaromyces islandicus]|uniref:Chitinase n=1 Tax=Talaromyces islandicus TaxID=28573 RepID=A0A0U1MBB6_TALIS|nr:chitinase [Talaromyces islandicus]
MSRSTANRWRGANGAYSLQSRTEAETIGQNLWNAYGNTASGTIPRPFGKVFVDGWDFDIESNNGNQYYPYLISALRSNFASDPGHMYYITGAPQCVIPEPNMASMIQNAKFDWLWVQFYNNAGCAQYYLGPRALAETVDKYSVNPHWGGIMLWAAGFSDDNTEADCTYAQNGKSILDTGSPCSQPNSESNSVPHTSTPTTVPFPSSTSVATGTVVSQWGQVSFPSAVVHYGY